MRKIFLIILPLLCSEHSKAQEIFSAGDDRIFYGSLNLGANFSQVDGDGFSGYHKVGIAGGASVYVHFWTIFAASLGLGYAQKGSHEARISETSIGPAVFRYRAHLQYAEVPLLLHLLLDCPNTVLGKIRYSAGFSYSRLLSSTETSEDINTIRISPELYPFRKQDWSGIVGLGYRIYGAWFLSGQYQYTIGSIRSEPYIPPGYGQGRQRNNVMTLRLMYIIGSARQQ